MNTHTHTHTHLDLSLTLFTCCLPSNVFRSSHPIQKQKYFPWLYYPLSFFILITKCLFLVTHSNFTSWKSVFHFCCTAESGLLKATGGGGLVAKSCPTLAILLTVACQAPLSMGFCRQEYWNGLPCSSPGIFLTQGSNPDFLLGRRVLYHWATWEATSSPILLLLC